jgi:hypothetical protein
LSVAEYEIESEPTPDNITATTHFEDTGREDYGKNNRYGIEFIYKKDEKKFKWAVWNGRRGIYLRTSEENDVANNYIKNNKNEFVGFISEKEYFYKVLNDKVKFHNFSKQYTFDLIKVENRKKLIEELICEIKQNVENIEYNTSIQ